MDKYKAMEYFFIGGNLALWCIVGIPPIGEEMPVMFWGLFVGGFIVFSIIPTYILLTE